MEEGKISMATYSKVAKDSNANNIVRN